MAISSINYYMDFMKEIYKNIDRSHCDKIVWFGDSNILSLIYDFLAADGYSISNVLDNNKDKWGKIINRNWCMPFTFHYIDIPKSAVDHIVAGKPLPDLKIISPEEFLRQNRCIDKVLFFTSSYRAEEITVQLLKMGANERNIISLPPEGAMWDMACNYIHSQNKNKIAISSEKRKIILLKILEQFTDFCNAKGLRYYLAYGTLIGAVRHKGFIPWDDDIDVVMPIEDYFRFLDEYPKAGRYGVLSILSENEYFFPFAKLVDHETYLHHHGFPITWMQGMYIDIFPMSGFQKDIPFHEQWLEQSLLDIEWYWYYVSKDIVHKKMYDCRQKILDRKFQIKFNEADLVGVLTTLPAKPWSLDPCLFGEGCQLIFAGKPYRVPVGYDAYLKKIYGNYMQVPPIEEQRVHGFPAYIKGELR